jgi:hypothetical protein
VLRTVVEMEFGVLLVTAVSSGASLAERAGRMLATAFGAANAASPAGRP